MIHGRDVAAILLGAGVGKRMQSDLAKVLHPVLGRPLLDHVIDAVRAAGVDRIVVVVGHQAERVRAAMAGRGVEFVLQAPQLGTGHAVQQAEPLLAGHGGDLLVVCGDTPALRPATLEELYETHLGTGASATVLTAELDDPTGYGRVLRAPDDRVLRIVEHKDATPAERRVREINSGMFAFHARDLFEALGEVRPDNAQAEYYLTDTLQILRSKGRRISAHRCRDPREVLGVNTPEQLEEVERFMAEKVRNA